MFFSKNLSSNKLRQILQDQYKIYKRYPEQSTPHIKENLLKLESLINEGKNEEATKLAKTLENQTKSHYKKSFLRSAFDLTLAIGVALIAATVIRQMWFELYEIPTGSMRPTFREQDHLSVTKTPYGINVPLETEHFYFDPNLVQRGSVVIFSGDGIDLPDTDSTFLGIFPYKKRYIKRMIGKPGDNLYFYGGSVRGTDRNGEPLTDFKDAEWAKNLEYIPFITFEGKILSSPGGKLALKQMNQEIARLNLVSFNQFQGELYDGKKWVQDKPSLAKKDHTSAVTLSELWGMGNYAKTRLIGKEGELPVLEINHHASLSSPAPALTQDWRGYSFSLVPQKSELQLTEESLNQLMDNMYTARFIVKNGKAFRYAVGAEQYSARSPEFKNVPDGTYELYFGKGYKVGFGGTLSELPSDHPLLSKDPENIIKLYNLGIEFDQEFNPRTKNAPLPSRYAYFNEGDLYVMGAPLLKAGDPGLVKFVENEKKKGESADYLPFIDNEEKLTPEYLQAFGLKVPEKHYLVLGDNHAMSGDSRVFGFVPEANLQGAPSLIMWPFGDRWGIPKMKPYPLFTTSRTIVWILGGTGLLAWWIWNRRRLRKPLKF